MSYSDAGGRTEETQSVERMGTDGHYERYLDLEKEAIRVDSDTVRIVVRSYARDPNGGRQLVQVTEEQIQTLADGTVKTLRTTSNSDANGKLQAVEQEVEISKQISPDIKETTTSALTLENGEMRESSRTEQRETRRSQSDEFRKTNFTRDGNGNWQTREVTEGVRRGEGARLCQEENVLRPDSDGKMSVVKRTTKKETATHGEKQVITETYSLDLPGVARDGKLHLVERVTAIGRLNQDGQQSTQVTIENPDPGSPRVGMRVTSQSLDVVVRGAGGIAHETRSVQELDGSGNLSVVRVDIGTSNKPQ